MNAFLRFLRRQAKRVAPTATKIAHRAYTNLYTTLTESFLMERRNYRYYLSKVVKRGRLNANHVNIAGYSLSLPVSRGGIIEELLLFGCHEPLSTRMYSDLLREGDTVIEVGTNFGYYLAIASRIIGNSGTIWGFEPDPELYNCALQNSRALAAHVKILHKAVANEKRNAVFFRSEVPNYGALTPCFRPAGTVEVEVITLDEFCFSHGIIPNVIRMDIEGGELLALEGSRQLLRTWKPRLFIEVHYCILQPMGTVRILDLLAESGYVRTLLIDRTLDWPWIRESRREKAMQVTTIETVKSQAINNKLPKVFTIMLR